MFHVPKFCTKCGHALKDGVKFCPGCGSTLQETKDNADKFSMLKTNRKKIIAGIGICTLLIAGSGVYAINHKDTSDATPAPTQEVSTEAQTDNTTPAPKEEPKQQQSPSELAKTEMVKHGFTGDLIATSYGHSPDGFLVVEGNKGMRILIFDTKNNRVATVNHQMKLLDFVNQRNNRTASSMIVKFDILNDTRDKDAKAGAWKGSTHTIPINGQYGWDASGNVIPKMLYTCVGEYPQQYDSVLYEQKNVDLMNLFLREAVPLWKDADKHKISWL